LLRQKKLMRRICKATANARQLKTLGSIGIDISAAACRVMAKRRRDVCAFNSSLYSPVIRENTYGVNTPWHPHGFPAYLGHRAMKKNKILEAGAKVGASLQLQTSPIHRIVVVDGDPYISHLNAERTLLTRKFTQLPWLQPVPILRQPYTFEKLLGMVKMFFTRLPWSVERLRRPQIGKASRS